MTQLYRFNPRGERDFVAVDVNRDDHVDNVGRGYPGNDRVTHTTNDVLSVTKDGVNVDAHGKWKRFWLASLRDAGF